MKNLIIVITILMNVHSYSSQVNLIPNPSFEDTIACPNQGFGDIAFSKFWTNPTLYSPDYFNSCDTHTVSNSYSVPFNFEGYQEAKTGNAYGGIITSNYGNLREYIQVELIEQLIQGQQYCLSFFVSLGDKSEFASNEIGAYFSENIIQQNITINLSYTPQVANNPTLNPLIDKNNWIEVSGDFIAQGGERYMTIGNFKNNLESDTTKFTTEDPNWYSYHYIDDVSLTLCSEIGINEILNPEIVIFPNPTEGIFYIRHNAIKIQKIAVIDCLGNIIILDHNIYPLNNEIIELDISDKSKGIYNLLIECETSVFNQLIINH